MTDPGSVPLNAQPLKSDDILNDETNLTIPEEYREKKSFRRYCNRCKSYKPPRAHHCSVCDRCIVKMVIF